MPPIDPLQLLKALAPLLTSNGGIKGPTEANRICGLMKDAAKLVSRCVYINILKATESQEALERFIEDGGWDVLNQWLSDFKEIDNAQLLIEIMKLYRELPVTVDLLKKNSAAKTIKQLGKSEHEGLKMLSSEIVEKWMKKVREKSGSENTENDKLKKKKKSIKDSKDEKKDKERSKSDSKEENRKLDKNKSEDSKNTSDKSDKVKVKEETEDLRGVVVPGNGLKIHIKLERGEPEKKEVDSKKRPSTVKRLPGRFRATGLEEEPILQKKKPLSTEVNNSSSKRPGPEPKAKEEEPPEKKSRLQISTTIAATSTTTTTSTTVTSPTITSPGDIHAKLKTIPPAKAKGHEIHESSIFMDMITRGSLDRQPGPMRRKKKLPSINGNSNMTTPVKPTTPVPATPTTPPTPPSPTTINTTIAKSLPSVPSFYKDTLETSEESSTKTLEKSPSPTEEVENTANVVNGSSEDVEMKEPSEDGSSNNTEPLEDTKSDDSSEPKGLLTTGATTKKNKKRKSVSWREESKLRQYHYFDLDETERVNVNRVDFNQLKKQEMMMDRKAMESAKRLTHDKMAEQIPWRRPPVIDGLPPGVEKGANSIEKDVQRERELVVLQALFFNKDMLPDSPAEPDVEPFEPSDPKFIPLEDETTGAEENVYNHDQYHSHDMTKPLPPTNQQPPANPVTLPPELLGMLSSLQQGQQPDLMANVQSVLATVMANMGNQSQETYDKVRELLQPLQNQGLIPDMMNMGMGPGPMGPRPRLGLLGQAPPGFIVGPGPGMPGGPPPGMQGLPNMQGPPRFPHPGPDMQGDGWGENMMGGPPGQMAGRGGRGGMPMRGGGGRMPLPGPPNQGPMGPGPMQGGPGGPMQGPPQMRGGQRGGRMRGPENRAVCRHFAGGGCRRGNTCSFLHPGVNGPMQH